MDNKHWTNNYIFLDHRQKTKYNSVSRVTYCCVILTYSYAAKAISILLSWDSIISKAVITIQHLAVSSTPMPSSPPVRASWAITCLRIAIIIQYVMQTYQAKHHRTSYSRCVWEAMVCGRNNHCCKSKNI